MSTLAIGTAIAIAGGLTYLEKNYQVTKNLKILQNIQSGVMLKIVKNRGKEFTQADLWYETLSRVPGDKIALINAETGKTFTFAEVEAYSNKVANWALSVGIKNRDVVALFMENRPEYVMTWIGLCKIGAIIAMINSNNKKKTLLHALSTGNCSRMIYGAELESVVLDVYDELSDMPLFVLYSGGTSSLKRMGRKNVGTSLDDILSTTPSTPIDSKIRAGADIDSIFGYIYTSGTTGLPKACIMTNFRFMIAGAYMSSYLGINKDDTLYTCLPLYHSAGGMLGTGCFSQGCTTIISRKFSASRFMEHCTKYNATCTQYIGELARYLLNSKPTPFDTKHNLRIAFGNGMRPESWIPFQKRFRIPEIGEFYAATEGNQQFMNHTKTIDFVNFPGAGACGHIDMATKMLRGDVVLIEHDTATEMPVRDSKTGLCILCPRGKAGELVGLIEPTIEFDGYTDPEATKKKILTDVLQKGDRYFRTGDLLRYDDDNYLWFVDRVGDTFRWKGENVSTGEVAAAISEIDGITEANVYGVKIPGSEDGRACMVAITTKNQRMPDFNLFLKHVDDNLASYQRPLFVRLLPEMQSTTTFKQRKVDFVKEGFNPRVVSDQLYWFNTERKKYEKLDNNAYNIIVNGRSRL
jgi:acyl-CoA synthetase (AMP-forming)/AMP-acid ligase II